MLGELFTEGFYKKIKIKSCYIKIKITIKDKDKELSGKIKSCYLCFTCVLLQIMVSIATSVISILKYISICY